MSDSTGIEWTDATWNPWHGCHKISQGCKNCYMFRDKKRYGQDPNVVTRSKTKFLEPLKWPEPKLIFTCSWSDWLIEEADPWREEAYEIIRQTPQHTYQILTKRIDRAAGRLPNPPLPNVWLGVSVEDQQRADERIPLLLQTPAAIRFLSVEPLLGPVDLAKFLPEGIDWVIVGGESGPGARPMAPEWARSIRDQCEEAGVPFFFKQWGGYAPTLNGQQRRDQKYLEVPVGDGTHHRMLRFSHKRSAGRLLDGRTWDQFPEVSR